jgi:poly(A) polymerase
LRCASGEVDDELGLWWDEFQDAGAARQTEMLLPEGPGDKKRRRRKPRKKTAAAIEGEQAKATVEQAAVDEQST